MFQGVFLFTIENTKAPSISTRGLYENGAG